MLVSEWENSPNRQIHQHPSILPHPIKKPRVQATLSRIADDGKLSPAGQPVYQFDWESDKGRTCEFDCGIGRKQIVRLIDSRRNGAFKFTIDSPPPRNK